MENIVKCYMTYCRKYGLLHSHTCMDSSILVFTWTVIEVFLLICCGYNIDPDNNNMLNVFYYISFVTSSLNM